MNINQRKQQLESLCEVLTDISLENHSDYKPKDTLSLLKQAIVKFENICVEEEQEEETSDRSVA